MNGEYLPEIILVFCGIFIGIGLHVLIQKPTNAQVRRANYLTENREAQEKRADAIKDWASEQMALVPRNLKREDRHVLVKYGDLSKIWAMADDIWYDL